MLTFEIYKLEHKIPYLFYRIFSIHRLQEMEDPSYDKMPPARTHQRSKSAPSSSPKANKKKRKHSY